LVRPFKNLVAYEAEIREFLKEAETICDQAEARLNQPFGNDTSGKNVENAPVAANVLAREEVTDASLKDDKENILENKPHELRRNRDELRYLVEFIDKGMQDIVDIKHTASTYTSKRSRLRTPMASL
jgi:hypothetical protein